MIIKNIREAKVFLKKFSNKIKKNLYKNKTLIIIFSGHLGSGKTTFIKEIAKNLGIKTNLKSPTFVLWQIYPFRLGKNNFYLNHIDLYRIPAEVILKLNLKTQIKKKFNIFMIEWGEKLEEYFLKNKIKYIKISIKKNKKIREVSVEEK